MPQIYRRTPMPKCEFNKVAKLQKTSSIVDRIINIPLACEIVYFYNSRIILLIFLLQKLMKIFIYCTIFHCVKSVQIGSFFWSAFFRIRIEYGEILYISPYSVRIREKTNQKKLRICTLFTKCSLHS